VTQEARVRFPAETCLSGGALLENGDDLCQVFHRCTTFIYLTKALITPSSPPAGQIRDCEAVAEARSGRQQEKQGRPHAPGPRQGGRSGEGCVYKILTPLIQRKTDKHHTSDSEVLAFVKGPERRLGSVTFFSRVRIRGSVPVNTDIRMSMFLICFAYYFLPDVHFAYVVRVDVV
jgi:hypothetical protein